MWHVRLCKTCACLQSIGSFNGECSSGRHYNPLKIQHLISLNHWWCTNIPNKEFVLDAIDANECAFRCLFDKFKNDEEVVTHAMKKQKYLCMYVSKELLDNEEFIYKYVDETSSYLNIPAKK